MEVGQLWVKLGLDKSPYDKGLDQAEKQGRGFGATMKDVLRNAFSFAGGMAIFETAKEGFKAVIRESIGFNPQLEQSRIAFTTMLGSAEKAGAFLKELQGFAAETPFEFPELVEASRKMLALGFTAKDVVPTLRSVGDAAAGLGLGSEGVNRIIIALGQMRAKSKVSAEEMMQLTEAGVPAWEILAQAMGKSTAEVMKLSEQGFIPASQAIDVLVAGMEAKFPNMMQKQSTTFLGLLSTLKDEARNALADLTAAPFERLKESVAGVLNRLKAGLEGLRAFGLQGLLAGLLPHDVAVPVIKFLDQFAGTWENIKAIVAGAKPILADIWDIFKAGMEAVEPIIPPITEAVTGFFRFIAENWPTLKPIVIGLATSFLTFRGVTGLLSTVNTATSALHGTLEGGKGIWPLVSKLVGQYKLEMALLTQSIGKAPGLMGKISAGFSTFSKVLFGVNPMVLLVVAAIGLLAAGAYLVYKNWDKIKGWFAGLWGWVKAHAEYIIPIIVGVLTGGLGLLVYWIVKHWDDIKARTAEAWDHVKGLIGGAIDAAIDYLTNLPNRFLNSAKNMASAFWEGFKKALGIHSPSYVEKTFMAMGDRADAETQRMEQLIVRRASGIGAAAQGIGQAIKAGISEALQRAVDTAEFNVTRLDKLWELWKAGFRGATDSAVYLTAEIEHNKQELALLGQQMAFLQQKFEESKRVKGEDAEETRKLGLEIIDLQIKQASLGKEIEETTKKLQEQGKIKFSVENGKAMQTWTNDKGQTITEPVHNWSSDAKAALGQTNWDAAVNAVANARGLTTLDAESVVTSNWMQEQGIIPKFHSGGIFRAPRPGGEGLALLRDRERVIPPGRSDSLDYDRLGEAIARALAGLKVQGDVTVRVDGTGKMREFRLAY